MGRGKRLGQTTSTKHCDDNLNLEWVHGSHPHQMKPSCVPQIGLWYTSSNVTHGTNMPLTYTNIIAVHMHAITLGLQLLQSVQLQMLVAKNKSNTA